MKMMMILLWSLSDQSLNVVKDRMMRLSFYLKSMMTKKLADLSMMIVSKVI